MKLPYELPAILLVAAMFAVAEYTGQKEIIFPEIAALALGAWVMEKSPWQSSPFHFCLSPTLAALTGMLIVRYFEYEPFIMVTAAFCLVVLQLKLARANVLPSISAAILPIITRSDSWWYPLSVCVMTGIIALGRRALNRSVAEEHSTGTTTASFNRPESAHWRKLLAGVTLITAVAVGFDLLFMVAPPLIVAFVEMSKSGGAVREKAGRALILLVLAAFSGVSWLLLIHSVLHWPVWVSACVSTATVFLFYHALRMPFPPAVAIALLPMILPEAVLLSYPWQVLAGSTGFFMLSRACFGNRGFASGRAQEIADTGGASAD